MELTNIEEQALLALGISKEQYEEYVEQQREKSPNNLEDDVTGKLIAMLMQNDETVGTLVTMLMMRVNTVESGLKAKITALEKQVKELT